MVAGHQYKNMKKITIVIPSKSNLRYLKMAIPSIRQNESQHNEIIVYVDEDTDGTQEWLDKNAEAYGVKVLVNPYLGQRLTGIGKAYDKCVEASETEVFMIGHCDMVYCKNFDKNALEHLQEGTVVALTRIEPPNFPNAGEKIQKSFGQYPEDLDLKQLEEFVEEQLKSDKVTEGIFAPWMMYKSDFEALGGHDVRMHSCREDSDVFNRMLLAGYKFVQPWNALVWHFAGRGAGSNTNFDTEEDRIRHEQWKKNMNNSTREFIRKWKSNVKHEPLMKPIVNPIYDVGFRVFNCNLQLLAALEPLCHDIHVDCDPYPYIEQEQPNTDEILAAKILPLEDLGSNDVTVTLDGKTFTQQDYQVLFELGTIIKKSGRIGKSRLGQYNIEVEIERLREIQDELIVCKS